MALTQRMNLTADVQVTGDLKKLAALGFAVDTWGSYSTFDPAQTDAVVEAITARADGFLAWLEGNTGDDSATPES